MAVKGTTEAEFRVGLGINDNFSSAMKSAEKTAASAVKSMGSLSLSIVAVNQAMEIAKKVFSAVSVPVMSSVGAFMEAEKVNQKLANTLALTGQYSRAAMNDFMGFASEMQDTASVNDEAVKSLISLGKSMRLTDQQTKNMIRTAADLSAVTDQSLEASFQSLQETLKGSARSLARLAPELGNLTEAELKAGAGIELLGKKFQGFGVAAAKTMDGQIRGLKFALSDLSEDIGQLFVEMFDFGSTSSQLKAWVAEARKQFALIREPVLLARDTFVNTFKAIGDGMRAVPWKEFADNINLIAASVAILAGPAVLKGLAAFSVSLWSVAAPAALIAVKFALVVAAVGSVIAIFDILTRNAGKLDQLGEVIAGAFILGFQKIESAFLELMLILFEKTSQLAASVAKLFPNMASGASAVVNTLARSSNAITERVIKVNLEAERSLETLKEVAEGIDFGLAGTAVKSVTSFVNGFTASLEKAEKAGRKASSSFTPPEGAGGPIRSVISQEVLQQLDQYKKLTDTINDSLSRRGKSEFQIAEMVRATRLAQLATIEATIRAANAWDSYSESVLAARKAVEDEFAAAVEDLRPVSIRFLLEGFDNLSNELSKIGVETFKEVPKMMMEAMRDGAKAAVDVIMEADLGEVFSSLASGLIAGLRAVSGGMVMEMVKGFASAVEALPQQLKTLVIALVDAAPALVDAILRGIAGIIDILPSVFKRLLDALPGIIVKIMEALPGIILKLFEAIPQIIVSLVRAIPFIIEALLKNIDKVVGALVEGLIAGAAEIAVGFVDSLLLRGGLERIIVALIKAIPRVAVAFVKAIWDGLMRAVESIGDLFSGRGFKVPTEIENFGATVVASVKNIGKALADETSQLFQVVSLKVGGRSATMAEKLGMAIDSATNRSAGILSRLWTWLGELWDKIIGALKSAWMFIYSMFLEPFVLALQGAWKLIWENILKPLLDGLWAVWMWVVENVLTPIFDFVVRAFTWVIDNVFAPLWGVVKGAFGWIVDFFSDPGAFAMKVYQAFLGVMDFFGRVGSTIWEGVKTAFSAGFSFFTKAGTWIWDGLKTAFSSPVNGFLSILNNLNPLNLFKKMFNADFAWGKGWVENKLGIDVPFMQFASGGLVPGSAAVGGDSLMNDRILALLSPGEAIIPRSLMENDAVRSLVNAVLEGKISPPKFGFGGWIKNAVSSVGGAVGGAVSSIGSIAGDALSSAASALGLDSLWTMALNKVMEMFSEMFTANGNNFFADGGIIGGGRMGVDSVPIMAQPGEFIVNRRATLSNMKTLEAMNSGQAIGGGGGVTFNMPVTINAKTSLDADSIRREVVPAIERHFKRRSQDGAFIIDAAGVRK